MMIFLGVLTIGFIYEWKKGALNGNKIDPFTDKQKKIPDEFKDLTKLCRKDSLPLQVII